MKISNRTFLLLFKGRQIFFVSQKRSEGSPKARTYVLDRTYLNRIFLPYEGKRQDSAIAESRKGFLNTAFYLIMFFFITTVSFSQNTIDKTIELFNKRHEKATGLLADSNHINKCIAAFEAEIKKGNLTEKCALYYLLSLNFKVRFVYTDDKQKKKRLDKNIELSKAYMKRFPLSGPILFEYITSVGLKAELTGAFANASNGIVEEMHKCAVDLIRLDSMYYSCTGWKVLGILNYKTPYIPLIISWPSKTEAKRILEKALHYFPADVANNFYYAEALLENNETEKARVYFNLVLKLRNRENFVLEDLDFKAKAKEYLKTL